LRGSGCGYVTTKVAICGDAMFIHGDEQPPLATVPPTTPLSTSSTSIYGGVLVGFAIN
jgi:hypothetical protein